MNTDRNQSRLVYISGEGYGDGYIPFDGAYFDGRDWILEKVKKGEIIRVKPQDISRNDGVPIVNLRQGKKGKSFVGFIEELYPGDIDRDREYEVIIRGIKQSKKGKKGVLTLQEYLKEGDMLHVFAEGYSDKGRLLRGEFLDYRILIETVGEDPNLDVKPKDHYFGRVVKVNDNHTEATIIPIKAVNGGRAEKNKGRIYHSERKSIV